MNLILYTITIFLLIASPGPIITLVLKSSKNGIKSSAPTIIGASLASVVLLIGAFFALFLGMRENQLISNSIKILGGLYLLWLGYCCYKDKIEPINTSDNSYSIGVSKTFLLGISNPKDIIFLLSFLSGFIIPNTSFIRQALLLGVVWIIVDLVVMILYAEFAKKLFKYKFTPYLFHWLPIVVIPMVGIFAIWSGIFN